MCGSSVWPVELMGLVSLGSLLLEHGQDIADGVFKPRDQWPAAAKDSFLVRFELTLIALEAHTVLS